MAGHRRAAAPRPTPDVEAALDLAARFLGTRPRSRWELERRLRRAGATDEVRLATLYRLTQLGHVDDAAFVRWWAEQRDRHAPRGRMRLEAELRAKGIPRPLIEAWRAESEIADDHPDGLPASEDERARRALERHLRGRSVPNDPAGRQRLGTFLVRRGFDAETARQTIRAAADAEDLE